MIVKTDGSFAALVWTTDLLALAPAHVGEEDQEEGDGEEGLVQHSLQQDHPRRGSHGPPRVQPPVPSRGSL